MTKTKKNKKKKKNGDLVESNTPEQSDESKILDKVECLEKMFEYSFRNYSLYSESIDDYINKKKPSLRKRLIYHTITLNLFITSLIYLSLYLNSAGNNIKYLGTPLTYIFVYENTYFGYFLFSIGLMSIVFYRMSVFYSESRFQFIAYDNFCSMKVFKQNKLSNNQKNPIDCDSTLSRCVNLSDSRSDFNPLTLTKCCIIPFYHLATLSEVIMVNVSLAMFVICLKTITDTIIILTIKRIKLKKK